MRDLGIKWVVVLGVAVLASCAPRSAPSVPPTPPAPAETVTPRPTIQPTKIHSVSTSVSTATATLRVTATIGPTCPGPQREGQICTQPYSGEFTVTDRVGNEVARFTTDADGHYTLEVAPGDYRVAPVTGGRSLPRGNPVDVTLTEGQTVEISLELDTGIR